MRAQRKCFGFSLDLNGILPPNFPITATFPWLRTPYGPLPSMAPKQPSPSARDFSPPPDTADL
jgi:hypothetical protein